jgi:pimeloyl-ACP methyl ester carboxylesterase
LFNDFNHIEYAITEELLSNIASEFSDTGLYGPVAWYANIDENIQLSSKWKHNEVTQKVSFIFGEDDKAVLLTEKMKDRLNKEAKFVTIKEVSGAGHWLPYTHRESVLNEIYSINKDY